jgi:hypothetical protein
LDQRRPPQAAASCLQVDRVRDELAHLRFFNFGWHIQHWPLIIAVELVVLNSIVGFILSGDQNT